MCGAVRRFALAMIVVIYGGAGLARGAITPTGDVNPVPPAGGGPVVGPLRIGNTTLGLLDISGGTALTNSGNAFVGDSATGIGIVTMSGFNSNWTLTSGGADLSIGVDGTGSVSLSDLARVVVPDNTVLGDDSTGIGEITVQDLGSRWTTNNLFVGESGRGIVNILAGGQIATGDSTVGALSGSVGRVLISDDLSLWGVDGGVIVGNSGSGTITILDGGALRTTSASVLANAAATVGTVEVNGSGSSWSTGNSGIVVGQAGSGTVRVLNGGLVSTGAAVTLGSAAGSRGDIWVDGLGSRLKSTTISAGAGDAQLVVSNGGVVAVNSVSWSPLARMTLAGGRIEVTGQDLFANQGLIQGSGTIAADSLVNQQNGPTRGRIQIATDDHLMLTGTFTNTGFVDLAAGELEVRGTTTNNFDIDARNGAVLRFGGLGLQNNAGSQLAVTAGEVDVFGAVLNNSGAQILVANGASAIFHDTLTNNGDLIVMPGSSILALEQLNLFGDASSVQLVLGEADSTQEAFFLQSAGTINIAGGLNVVLADGYQPQAGEVFPLLSSGSNLVGAFSEENLPDLDGGLNWEFDRTANSLSLVVMAAGLHGDFDGDGDVDGRDFLAWQRGDSPTPRSPADLTDWRENYGAESSSAASTAVPEPITLVTILGAVPLLALRGSFVWRAAVCRLTHQVPGHASRC